MYDFRSLSPIDFELLVRDLLQAELGITMESFGPGKDGGIDFRFATASQDAVVQAKHHVEGGARSLLGAAMKEDCKVLKLAPSRYILVTSLSLTPDLKRKVIQAMPSTPVSAGDVIGREDLNNFLGLHPHVLRQHFKLWLTSTEVLERILHSAVYNRTDAELARIKQLVPKFVHNASVAEADKILEDRGALIIAGEPGVGKTTLGRMLLWLHMEQNWKVFVVDDLQEAMAVSTAGEKRLIFLDDFLGQISLTNELLGKVDQRLPVFLDRLRNNKDLRFILTTRLYLLNQAQNQSDKLSSPRVAASEMILNVGVYTRVIRAKVVFNHIYFSDLVDEEKANLLDGDFFLKMIDHRNFSPRLIELLTSADYYSVGDESIRATVLRVLDNPSELWERPYRSHLSTDARFLLWAIFFTGPYVGKKLCLQLFKRIAANAGHQIAPSEAVSRFRTGLRELSGSFVTVPFRTDELLFPACEALTNAAANMLANAGDDLAIDDITSIASALEPLTEESLVHSAASNALQGFICGIEGKLSDISSTQELETFREDLVSAAKTYGVRIAQTLMQDIQSRRETLEEREGEEDTDPYQQAGPQVAAGEISDAEIKSMFSLMSTGPVSG